MYKILKEALFNGPPRGVLQLILSILSSALYFFVYNGRGYSDRPTIYEQFQRGNPDDFAVIFTFGLLLWIGYSIAVTITDYRNSGRFW